MAAVRAFMESYRRIIFLAIFALFLVAAGVGVSVVRGEQLADWFMHLGMWAILGAYLAITARGLTAGRKVGPAANLVLLGLFSGFWVWTLHALIPGRPTVILGTWQSRPELGILWLPIILLVLVWCLMLAMTVGLWGRPSQPACVVASPEQIELPPQQVELPPQQVELPHQQVELPPQQVEPPK